MSTIYEALKKFEREGGNFPWFGSFLQASRFSWRFRVRNTITFLFVGGIVLATAFFVLSFGIDWPSYLIYREKNISISDISDNIAPEMPPGSASSGSLKTGEGMQEVLSPAWEDLFAQALSFEDKGLSDKATELYLQIKSLKPEYVPTYMSLGRLYYRRGFYEKAIEAYSEAISLSPFNPRAYNNRGTAYLKTGLIHLAIIEYKKALELDAKYSMSYYNLSSVYAKRGEYENHDLALSYLEKAVSYNPEASKWAQTDPDFLAIRDDQRFKKLIEESK